MSATNQLISANANPANLLGDYWANTEASGGGGNTTYSTYLQLFPGTSFTSGSPVTIATQTFNNNLPSGQGRLTTSVTYNFGNTSTTQSYTLLLYYLITLSDTEETQYTSGQMYLTVPTQNLGVSGSSAISIQYGTPVTVPTGNYTLTIKGQCVSSSAPGAGVLTCYALNILNTVGTLIQ
jgi:hypothetical protein